MTKLCSERRAVERGRRRAAVTWLLLLMVLPAALAGCGGSDSAGPPAANTTARPSGGNIIGPSRAPEPTVPRTPSMRPPSARTPVATATPQPTASAAEPWVDLSLARTQLKQLPVKGRAPMTGYSRDAFGTAWSDTNDNGCDTRNDVLRRDLRGKTVEDCVVTSGILRDPYSGQQVVFERGPVTSLDVQIDHVVAMGNAWATGAQRWSPYKRERFANDRRNLLAVRGDLNMQKGDGDAATWLPPRKAYRCTYVAMQIQTKYRYGLWVTAAEKASMERILASC